MNLSKSPWSWVPSLYFAEGLPNVAVTAISVLMFKQMGLTNAEITFYTSWLYLPWTLKFIWSPFVDLMRTKRWWVITMQLLIGAAFGGVAFTIPTEIWLQGSLCFLWLMAFTSATHDIAADGYYMLALVGVVFALVVLTLFGALEARLDVVKEKRRGKRD